MISNYIFQLCVFGSVDDQRSDRISFSRDSAVKGLEPKGIAVLVPLGWIRTYAEHVVHWGWSYQVPIRTPHVWTTLLFRRKSSVSLRSAVIR